jgi:hypothetical protein
MKDERKFPDASYAFMHFAEAVGLSAARALMPLLGVPFNGDPFRQEWRAFLDASFDYPDHLVDPGHAEELAWAILRRQDDEARSGRCLTRAFECGFQPNDPFVHHLYEWVDALRRWASIQKSDSKAIVQFWQRYNHRRTEFVDAESKVIDPWDRQLFAKYARQYGSSSNLPYDVSPFDNLYEAVERADICRSVAALVNTGEIGDVVSGTRLDMGVLPRGRPCS